MNNRKFECAIMGHEYDTLWVKEITQNNPRREYLMGHSHVAPPYCPKLKVCSRCKSVAKFYDTRGYTHDVLVLEYDSSFRIVFEFLERPLQHQRYTIWTSQLPQHIFIPKSIVIDPQKIWRRFYYE